MIKNSLKSFKISPYKKLTHKNYKKIVIEEVFADISLSKISIRSDMRRASVLPAIFSFSVEPTIFKTDIASTDYQEMERPLITKKKLDKTGHHNQRRLETIVLGHTDLQIAKGLQKKLRRKDEILVDLSTAFFLRSPLALIERNLRKFKVVEKWTDNYPYSKPLSSVA